jgi:hypothetical protein
MLLLIGLLVCVILGKAAVLLRRQKLKQRAILEAYNAGLMRAYQRQQAELLESKRLDAALRELLLSSAGH